ncbi:hypothetical protein OIU78_005269 [Salix suchowensis]|nr:hypothetical protein OIU78_005269 [Salix suchowensis]KAJ6357380.1 hypothetical protein OIU78_005269 [Salix suchowensis]
MVTSPRIDSFDYRIELLSPPPPGEDAPATSVPSWRLNMDRFQLPERRVDSDIGLGSCLKTLRRRRKVAEYYRKQEELLEGFNEVDSFTELGTLPEGLTENEMKQLAKSEKVAIYASNVANLVLFAAKVYASVQSRSMAVIASTLDSLLDLLSGFILWFTDYAMKKQKSAPVSHWQAEDAACGDSSFCISNGNSWTANIVRVRKTTSYKGTTRQGSHQTKMDDWNHGFSYSSKICAHGILSQIQK